MSYFDLTPELKFKLKSMPRGRQYPPGSILNSCNLPFRSVTVDVKGQCLICICDGWLPISVGHATEFDSLEQLFSSRIAKVLQQDVVEKKFTWCAVDHCGIKNRSHYQKNFQLIINTDESCNLACPSCRRNHIMLTNGNEFENKIALTRHVLSWLDKFDDPIVITMSGNGDPLASAVMRPVFVNFVPKINQQFILKTNGLLIDKILYKSKIVPNLISISISVDAGSGDVYHQVRRGGEWSVLLRNLDYLQQQNLMNLVSLQFCLQQKNYADLENFAELCALYDRRGSVHALDDWGTWNNTATEKPDQWTLANGFFYDHNVLDRSHPDWHDCRDRVMRLLDCTSLYFSPLVLDKLDLRSQHG